MSSNHSSPFFYRSVVYRPCDWNESFYHVKQVRIHTADCPPPCNFTSFQEFRNMLNPKTTSPNDASPVKLSVCVDSLVFNVEVETFEDVKYFFLMITALGRYPSSINTFLSPIVVTHNVIQSR